MCRVEGLHFVVWGFGFGFRVLHLGVILEFRDAYQSQQLPCACCLPLARQQVNNSCDFCAMLSVTDAVAAVLRSSSVFFRGVFDGAPMRLMAPARLVPHCLSGTTPNYPFCDDDDNC